VTLPDPGGVHDPAVQEALDQLRMVFPLGGQHIADEAIGTQHFPSVTAFTPSWTGVTVGDGSTSGSYIQLGPLVFIQAQFIFGSTSAITGNVSFTTPVSQSGQPAGVPGGPARFLDNNVGTNATGLWRINTQEVEIRVIRTDATYNSNAHLSSTVPWTWATDDTINISGFYRAAN
jgi:hypothetical protein